MVLFLKAFGNITWSTFVYYHLYIDVVCQIASDQKYHLKGTLKFSKFLVLTEFVSSV